MIPRLGLLVLGVALSAVTSLGTAAPAVAHRDSCHQRGDCPSDHGTYLWRGLLCAKPDSDRRTASFTEVVRHAGLTYYCKRKAAPAAAAGATSGFHTPQWAAQCLVEGRSNDPADTTLLCWTPNDGFYVRMTPQGRVTKGYAERFRRYRDTVRAGRLLSFGGDWYHRSPGFAQYGCESRKTGLTCGNHVRHAGLTYYCKGTATPAPATGATSGFHTPQWAAQCVVEAHGKPGDSTLLCWTPNDGFYVRMTPMGTVTKGYAQRFRGYRDTRRAGRLRSFGQDWYHRSPGFNQYGCQSRSTGLTCGNHESHGWWLGRYKGYRIF